MILKICLILVTLFQFACQKKSDINVHMPKTNNPAPTAQQQEPTQGTVDGGGCNGIHGLCLEAYQQDIVQFPEYQEFIQPILDRLHRKLPKFATNLEYIAQKRSWYFIPEKLKNITSNKLEVAFATEQVALQGMFEIWIDKKMYQEMSTEKRAKLLLHEMLMGNKILEFHNFFEICNASSSNSTENEFCNLQDNAYKSSSAFNEIGISKDKIKIEAQDYLAIREVTNALISNKEPKSSRGLASWLNNLKHRTYKVPTDEYVWLYDVNSNLNLHSIYEYINTSPNFSTEYGYYNVSFENNMSPNSMCEFKTSFDKNNNILKINLVAQSTQGSAANKVYNFTIKENYDPENPSYEIELDISKNETALYLHSYIDKNRRETIKYTFYGNSLESVIAEEYTKKDSYWGYDMGLERQGKTIVLKDLICLNKPKFRWIEWML